MTRYLKALTTDSLRQRVTPSSALDRTARYVAAEFQRLGLQAGMRERGQALWIQHYPLPGGRSVALANSQLYLAIYLQSRGVTVLTEAGNVAKRRLDLNLATAPLYFTPEVGPQAVALQSLSMAQVFSPLGGGTPVIVVAGAQSVAAVQHLADTLRERAVLYVPAAGADAATQQAILAALYAVSPAVLVVSDQDSVSFARAAVAARRVPPVMVDGYVQHGTDPRHWHWALTIWAPAIRDILQAAGMELAALRTDSVPLVRPLPTTSVYLEVAGAAPATDLATAPNVIGIVGGRDSVLRRQYILVAARMDTDSGEASADSLGQDGGARAEASSLAGLLALAWALSRPEAQPQRSVVLLAMSGGAENSWGGNFFAEQDQMLAVPGQPSLVGSLTFDLRHDAATDSVWISGLHDVELAISPAWVARMHPELGLVVVDGGTVVQARTPASPFVWRTVPSWYVHTEAASPHAQRPPTDAADLARVMQFVFDLSQALATADQPPRWSVEGRRHLEVLRVP